MDAEFSSEYSSLLFFLNSRNQWHIQDPVKHLDSEYASSHNP